MHNYYDTQSQSDGRTHPLPLVRTPYQSGSGRGWTGWCVVQTVSRRRCTNTKTVVVSRRWSPPMSDIVSTVEPARSTLFRQSRSCTWIVPKSPGHILWMWWTTCIESLFLYSRGLSWCTTQVRRYQVLRYLDWTVVTILYFIRDMITNSRISEVDGCLPASSYISNRDLMYELAGDFT